MPHTKRKPLHSCPQFITTNSRVQIMTNNWSWFVDNYEEMKCNYEDSHFEQIELPAQQLDYFFLSFFLGWRIPNFSTGLSGWCSPDKSRRIQQTVPDHCWRRSRPTRWVKTVHNVCWLHPWANKFQQSSLPDYEETLRPRNGAPQIG